MLERQRSVRDRRATDKHLTHCIGKLQRHEVDFDLGSDPAQDAVALGELAVGIVIGAVFFMAFGSFSIPTPS